MLALVVAVHSWWLTRTPDRSERGQAAAEYALVLLGAAAVALLVTKWAGKTDRVGKLFDAVLDQVLGKVK
jgi:Flp pilus assembly pilin Flp